MLDYQPPSFLTDGLDKLICLLQVAHRIDPQQSAQVAREALHVSLKREWYLPEDTIQLYGEAAIASISEKNYQRALDEFAMGYRLLLDNFKDKPEYQAAIILYGNAIKYINELLNPKTISDFGEGKNVIPEPGYFYSSYEKLLAEGNYFKERNFIGATGLQNAYENTVNSEQAKFWAYKSIELSLDITDPKFAPILQPALFYLVDDKNYRQA